MQLVVVRLSHFAGFNQLKHDLAEIVSTVNSPGLEDHDRHHSEMLQTQASNSVQQFRPTNVPRRFRRSITPKLLLCKPQCGEHELVGHGMVGPGSGMVSDRGHC